MKTVRIACGSGYWGDALDPAIELAEKGNIDYLGFDHLAELTMALLHKQKEKNPSKGYIPDIVPWFEKLLPICQKNNIKMITDAGGANPVAAAEAVIELAKRIGISNMKLGVVTGDDLTDKLDEIRASGLKLTNTDTGEEDIDRVKDRIVSAYAYIGSEGIIDALDQGCNHVITGRVSDNSLYIGPLMHEFGWDFSEKFNNNLGAAITTGHIIECGCPCTGGISNLWKESPDNWKIGFPIVEMNEKGDAIISKVEGSGGIINNWTIKEHLVYEVMDPHNYFMPDGIADFTTLKLEEIGKDQVKITNMTGKGRPDMLKVCIGVEEGYVSEAMLLFPWPDAYEKAKRGEELMRKRFEHIGIHPQEMRFDYIGVNTLHGATAPEPTYDMNEVGLRIAIRAKTFEEADQVRRMATHIWTMGPIGTSCGVPFKPRKIVGLWPTLVPREFIKPQLKIMEVK
mgnify:CR=1 FL=1